VPNILYFNVIIAVKINNCKIKR